MYERVGLPPLIDSILEPNFVAMLSTLSSNLIVTFDVENLSHPCTLKVVGRSTLAELCSYSAHFKYMFNFFACSRYRSHTLIERMFEFFLWSNEPVVHVELNTLEIWRSSTSCLHRPRQYLETLLGLVVVVVIV